MTGLVITQQKKYILSTFAYYLISVLAWIMSIVSPKLFGYFIDLLTLPSISSMACTALFTFLLVSFIQSMLSLLRAKVYNSTYMKISHGIYIDVYSHVLTLSRKDYTKINPYYFNESVTADAFEMTSYVMNNLFNLIMTSLTFLMGLIILFQYFSLMGLVIVLLLLIYFFLHYYSYNRYHVLNINYIEEVNSYYAEKGHEAEYIDFINYKSWREKSVQRVNESFGKSINAYDKVLSIRLKIDGVASFVRVLIIGVMLYMSLISIENDKMGVGGLISVNTYVLMILSCVSDFLAFVKSYSRATIAYNRLKGYLSIRPAEEGSTQICTIPSVTINNLSFHNADNSGLRGLSCKLVKGNIYGITGENGIGKTTFLRILTGLEKEYQGEICIGEKSLREIDTYSLRKYLVSVVTQVPTLYFDNICDELCFEGKQLGITIDLFDLNKLVDGFFRGNNGYSTGQKQKLNIVQALNKKADLIIMDEPTSSLDDQSVEELVKILRKMRRERIIVLVSHDNRILNICDDVIGLHNYSLPTNKLS